jgi:hypothetical protein
MTTDSPNVVIPKSRDLLLGNSYMPAPQGHCWLCNQFGKLSKEHIPPEKAFNDCPLLLMKVDERSTKKGVLEWAPDRRQRGVYFRSLVPQVRPSVGLTWDRYNRHPEGLGRKVVS